MTRIIEYPQNIGDWLAETALMNPEQRGVYISLKIIHAKQGYGGLPDDDETLARLCGCTLKVWKRLRPEAEKNFVIIDGFWVSESVRKVIQAVDKRAAKPDSQREPNGKDNQLKLLDLQNPHARANHQPSSINEVKNIKHPLATAARDAAGVNAVSDGYRVLDWLDADGQQGARAAAPGWDIGKLAEIFDNGIRDGTRQPPKHPRKPDGYFIGFCRSYTKGKRP